MWLGETVIGIDGQHFRLTSITPRAGPETVYNFEVAIDHVYYVGKDGLLVHNFYTVTLLKTGVIGVRNAAGKFASYASAGLAGLKRANNPVARAGNEWHHTIPMFLGPSSFSVGPVGQFPKRIKSQQVSRTQHGPLHTRNRTNSLTKGIFSSLGV